ARQEPATPVVLDEGPGIPPVDREPPPHRALLVVRPLGELPPTMVAPAGDARRRKREMVVPATAAADPAAAEPRDQLLLGHVEKHHALEWRPFGVEQPVERLRLGHRPREAVQDEALPAVRLSEALADEPDDHAVGDELAGIHVAPCLEPEGRAVRDRL